jgi:hypothetical protein
MAQKAVSSEGRGLRVREYGPDASRRHNMIIGGKRTFGGLMGRSPGGTEPHLRACGARPSGGLVIGAGMAYRGKPSGDAEGDFLGGKAKRTPRDFITWKSWAVGRWPNGDTPRSSGGFPCGRAEPAPPRGGLSRVRWPCWEKARDDAKGGFLGGARSPRPRIRAGR